MSNVKKEFKDAGIEVDASFFTFLASFLNKKRDIVGAVVGDIDYTISKVTLDKSGFTVYVRLECMPEPVKVTAKWAELFNFYHKGNV